MLSQMIKLKFRPLFTKLAMTIKLVKLCLNILFLISNFPLFQLFCKPGGISADYVFIIRITSCNRLLKNKRYKY